MHVEDAMYGLTPDFDKTFVGLHLFNCTLSQQDNVPSAEWIPTGAHIEKNQTPKGYLSDAFMLQEFPSMGAIDMGGGDNTPGTVVLQLKQADPEVDILLSGKADDFFNATIRNYKQVNTEKRLYVNNRTMCIWCRVMPGVTNKMTIGLEVHTVAEKINDGNKVTLSAADCMTNSRIPSHNLNERLPKPVDPPTRTGDPVFEEWSSALTNW